MSKAPKTLAPCDHDECGLTECRLLGGSDQRLVLRWEDLPLIVDETEHDGEWSRKVERVKTVGSLLEIWDIDDESDHSAMAQVLRYLREYFPQNAECTNPEGCQ